MNKKIEEITLEIVELKKQLDQAQKENNRKKTKHLLEKSKAILKIIAAGTAVPIAGTALTTLAGWKPFKLNEEKQNSQTNLIFNIYFISIFLFINFFKFFTVRNFIFNF